MESVANDIGLVGLYTAIAVFVILTLHVIYDSFYGDEELFSLYSLKHIINALIIGVTIIVVAVPEVSFCCETIKYYYMKKIIKRDYL